MNYIKKKKVVINCVINADGSSLLVAILMKRGTIVHAEDITTTIE